MGKGIKAIHCPIKYSDDHSEISGDYGVLQGVKAGKCFLESDFGSDFVDGMKPVKGDLVVSGKRGLCGFQSTMRSAYELGYDVHTIIDACAATGVEPHEATIKYNFGMFSKPQKVDEFIAQFA